MIGTRLANRYEILREVGRGGMGVVYAANDPMLDREVAIKVLAPSAMSTAAEVRFRGEARIVAAMDHPGIVPVYDVGEHEGALFLVMPLLRALNLRRYLEQKLLNDDDAIDIGMQIAEALDHSHSRGVVHRDIKPENILVSREGSDVPRVRLTDFGLALAASQERHTRSGSIVGSMSYLAPEQIARGAEIDRRSDIYSLGTVMYECLAGQLPFEATFPALLYAIRHDPPRELASLRPTLPEDLVSLVMRCLAKSPGERPQDVREVAETLRSIRIGGETREQRISSDRRIPSPPVTTIPQVRTIGREAPLQVLRDRLDAAIAGDAQLVVIGGQAGVGKSRMLDELRREALRRDVLVLHGRFYEQDRSFPYQAFCEAIQEYFTKSSGGASFADLAADLVALFPVLRETDAVRAQLGEHDVPQSVNLGPERARVFDQLARTFLRITGDRPLLLLLEELQTADVSIEALHFLFRRVRAAPLMIVGTYRSDEISRGHGLPPLIQNLRGDASFTAMELEPLSREQARELVEELLHSRNVEDAAIEKIWKSAEGNPLFTTELVKAMVESKALFLAPDGRWMPSRRHDSQWEELPATIQETVERRVQRLPEAGRKLLATASILGRRFDLADLEPLLEDVTNLDALVQSLLESGLLDEDREVRGDVFAFTSAVVRDVLYASIPRRRRRTLHLRHAENLERRHGTRAERIAPDLLHHFAHADAREKVFDYGLRLANRYLESFSAEDAMKIARTVLDFADDEAGEECAIAGEAKRIIAASHRLLGNTDAALQSATEAFALLERCENPEGAARAARVAAETAWERRRLDDARRWAERGITVGRRGAEPADLRKLLFLSATIANVRGEHAVAQERLAEAEAVAPSTSTPSKTSDRVPGVIHVAVAGDLRNLDPSVAFTMAQSEVLPAIFDTLTRATDAARIEPWLVESYSASSDGLRYDFRLREGVRFHDGAHINARDVRHSFERLLRNERSESRSILSAVRGAARLLAGEDVPLEGFAIGGERDFSITLEQPVAFFPALLTNGATAVVPDGTHDFAANWRDGCSGTGPFRVTRFEPGRKVELEANPFYWRAGLPKAERLVFTLGVSPEEMRDGFVRGRFSIVGDLYPAHVEALRVDRQFASSYREVPRLSTYYLVLNANHGVLADVDLRREVMKGVDVESLVTRHVGREGIRANGFIPPGLLGHEPDPPRFIDEKTSRIPAEPFANLTAMLNSSYHKQYAGVAQELFSMLAAHGFAVRVLESRSEYFANQAASLASADLVLTRWIADYPDANDFVSLLHSRRGFLSQLCGRPEIDTLIERGQTEGDSSARHEIYREIEKILREQALLLPLFYEQAYRFSRPDVEGLELNFTPPVVSYEKLSPMI